MTSPLSADGWVQCGCGNRHWGKAGAAGLLISNGHQVVLQHRASWSHFGDTWGIPGGARDYGETAIQAALRESYEEAGIEPSWVQVIQTHTLTHPDWSYTTVVARSTASFTPVARDAESQALEWVDHDDVARYPLLPAFATAWPTLLELLTPHL